MEEERLTKYKCPLCNADLRLVEGEKGESKYSFWGCSRFPYCQFSISKEKLNSWIKLRNKSKDSFRIYAEYGIKISGKKAKKLVENLIEKNNEVGFVYFIRQRNGNLIKIGKTKRLLDRLSSLNSEMNGIIPVWIIKTKFYSAMEVFFHTIFKKFLVKKNEYFKIPPEYLIEIVKIKEFLGEKVVVVDKMEKEITEFIKKKERERIESEIKESIKSGDKKRRAFWRKKYKEMVKQ